MRVGIANKKFITTAEFKRMGYYYYKIGKLEKDGILSRINRSIYENFTYKGEENDFFSAEAYVSNGVICLISAAQYYELTNFVPEAALRETLLNYLCHSQYNYGVPIQISEYDDKMYIADCGQLPDNWAAENLGISKKTVAAHIKGLKEKGVIERIGNNKTGHWKINN